MANHNSNGRSCALATTPAPSGFNLVTRWLRVSQVAKMLGCSSQTIRNLCRDEVLSYKTIPGSTHRRIDAHSVHEYLTGETPDETEEEGVGVGKLIIVCRVSAPKQAQETETGSSLGRQETRLREFCLERFGKHPDLVIRRQASGLNYAHPVFEKFLIDLASGFYRNCTFVCSDRSRMLRMGARMIETIARIHNNEIIYQHETEDCSDDQLAEEILDILNFFVAKNNGKKYGRISEILLQPDDLKRAFFLRQEGHSFQSIAKILQDENRKDERGRKYSDGVIRKQLGVRWGDLTKLYSNDRETSFALFARLKTKQADDSYRVVRKSLLEKYRTFCKERKLTALTKNGIGQEVKRLGWTTTRSNQRGTEYKGLILES